MAVLHRGDLEKSLTRMLRGMSKASQSPEAGDPEQIQTPGIFQPEEAKKNFWSRK